MNMKQSPVESKEKKDNKLSGEGNSQNKDMETLLNKCLNILNSNIKMIFKKEPKHSKKSTLKLYIEAGLSNSYIESVVNPIKILAKMRNGCGVQSADTAIDRIETKKPKEILLFIPCNSDFSDFYHTIFNRYLPNKVVMAVINKQFPEIINPSFIKVKTGLSKDITIYICHNFTCSLPLRSVKEVENRIQ